MAERGPSAAASRSEGSYDAPHQPVSQVRVAVSHPADQGEYPGVITAPAPGASRVQPEHAAAGDEEASDPFSGIGFDFDDPSG